MKRYIFWLAVFVQLLCWVSTAEAQSEQATDIKEKCPYLWNYKGGNPCKIVVTPKAFSSRCTYYFTRNGTLFAIFSEDLDTPMSTRPVVSSVFYALDDQMEVVGAQWYNYNWADRGKVDTVFRQGNNYARSRNEQIRKPAMGKGTIIYSPKDIDSKGNWLEGCERILFDTKSDIYTRKIFYYDEAPKVEKEVTVTLARRDSLIAYCKANAWSKGEKSRANRKEKHGFGWNFLVPFLLGMGFGLVPSLVLGHKTKLSNLVILVLNIAIAWFVGGTVVSLVLMIGPYGSLWEGIFWFVAIASYLSSMSVSLYKRCPKCASYDCDIAGRAVQKETETEKVVNRDGSKEVLSRHTDYTTIEYLRCNQCGHTWKAFWRGIHK